MTIITKHIEGQMHRLPSIDVERHCIRDGVWCPCSPSVSVFDVETEDRTYIVTHTSFGKRKYASFRRAS